MTPRRQHKENANAEILGVVILIGIFAITAGIISATVLATPEAEKVPAASLAITNASEDPLRLQITHTGGDPLPMNQLAVRWMGAGGSTGEIVDLKSWLSTSADELANGFSDDGPAAGWVAAVLVWSGTAGESVIASWDPSGITAELGPGGLGGTAMDGAPYVPRTQPAIPQLPVPWSINDAVEANFTPLDNSTYQVGVPITFMDHSNGTIKNWSWNFGDGRTLETTAPGAFFTHTYTYEGVYHVTLTVTNNSTGAHDTAMHTIKVTPSIGQTSPIDFTISPRDSGNTKLMVNCTASVVSPSTMDVTSWKWDTFDGQNGSVTSFGPYYGDLMSSSNRTRDFEFENHDGFTNNTCSVMLTAWSPYVQDPIVVTKTVTVGAPLKASFTPNKTAAIAGRPIGFLDTSTGVVDSWDWDFGDGERNETQHPVHFYTAPGTYTVTLTVTGFDQTTPGDHMVTHTSPPATIVIEPPVEAAFTSNVTSGERPLIVLFNDQSTGGPTNWTWSFGDGATSHEQNPVHEYVTEGKFKVSLVAEKYDPDDSDIEVKEIYIYVGSPVFADFTANIRNGTAPLTVDFIDNSTSDDLIESWAWDFENDGIVDSIVKNPIHIYPKAGTYTVTLRAETANRYDVETKFAYVTVYEPVVANFTADQTNGMVPLTVHFKDTSTGNPTHWLWDFGDGNTSRDRDPFHTYWTADLEHKFTVTLTANHTHDSDTIVKTDYIIAGNTPIDSKFTANLTAGPKPLTIQFTDTSDGPPIGWAWNFGNGIWFNTTDPAQRSPTYTYNGSGNFTVQLTATHTAGSILSRPVNITVYEPIVARMSVFNSDGEAPLAVYFNDTSEGDRDRRLWDFGDGSNSTEQNPVHSYAGGVYFPTLTVWNSLRPDLTYTASTTVVAFDAANANFTANATSGVAPFAVKFTDNSDGNPTWWAWDFDGDGTVDSSEQNPTHVFTEGGTYLVTLRVGNPADADPTPATRLIVVSEILKASFESNVTEGSAPLAVLFSDRSTGDDLTAWSWTFGDGNTSAEQHPVHVYETIGTYSVSLTITNATGLKVEEKTDYITVTEPPLLLTANFSANVTSGSPPLAVKFTDLSIGDPTAWAWDFDEDGIPDMTDPNPVCIYEGAGTYSVNLTVTNPDGSDSEVKTDYITVFEPPMASFTGTPTTGGRPLTVQFTDTSSGLPIAWSWDFGDGSAVSHAQNPSHTYTSKGTYNVRLSVANVAGVDTLTINGYIVVT